MHLFMLYIIISGGIVASIAALLCQAYRLYDGAIRKARVRKLRSHFRRAYRQWKKAEAAGEYASYIDRQNAEMFHHELARLGA